MDHSTSASRLSPNVAAWERGITVALGVSLVIRAMRDGRPLGPSAWLGAALLARGTSGYCPVYGLTGFHTRDDRPEVALSGSKGTMMRASVTIARCAADVFGFWRRLDTLPGFVHGLERVELIDERSSRWTMKTAGVTTEWTSELINIIEPELIAWRSLAGSDVVSAGSVHFRDQGDRGTEVTVTMQYAPPAGVIGQALGWITGRGRESELRADLRRLKHLMEAAEISTVPLVS